MEALDTDAAAGLHLDFDAVQVLGAREFAFVSAVLESVHIDRAMASRYVGLAVWTGTPMLVLRPREIYSRMESVDVQFSDSSLQSHWLEYTDQKLVIVANF